MPFMKKVFHSQTEDCNWIISNAMVPLPPGLTETSHYWEVLIPKKRGTVWMLASAQRHPQLEGLQGTLPLRHCCVLEAKHI